MRGLPHAARLVYSYLRQYMDYETGITGIQRKVSLQSISEYLYVEPHQGIKEERYTHKQVRGALDWLEKAGLIERDKGSNKANRQSVFRLILATSDYSAQNKVGRGRADNDGRDRADLEEPYYNGSDGFEYEQVGNTNLRKEGNPPLSVIYNNNYNARDLFSMHEEWLPDKKIISMARRAGVVIPAGGISPEVLGEFINYWLTRPEVERTQDQWQHALIKSIKSAEVINANGSRNHSGYAKGASKLDIKKIATEEF